MQTGPLASGIFLLELVDDLRHKMENGPDLYYKLTGAVGLGELKSMGLLIFHTEGAYEVSGS